MTGPDVVSRLLAAIDEREREYNRCAEELREAARAKVRLPHTEFLRATVGEGLRLCQAHRDIVALWQEANRESNPPEALILADDVINLLARGYGVEGGETK